MKSTTLRSLLDDRRPHVAARRSGGCRHSGPAQEYLDDTIDTLVEMLARQRRGIPDKSYDLSIVDSVLVPILELHRAIFAAQPVEDQLEPSEVDMLTFGITAADLKQTAKDLGCGHLCKPSGPQPEEGRIVGIKDRILVVRTVRIREVSLSVAFLVDTGAPVTFVCAETLRAFGIDIEAQSGNNVRGEVEGGVVLNLYFLDPRGILGMDYLQRVDATLKFVGRRFVARDGKHRAVLSELW